MPQTLSPFSQWALDDARTHDERYLIFLLCDECRLIEFHRLPLEERRVTMFRSLPYEMWKEYYLNPLLMPTFTVADTERAAALAPWLTKFDQHWSHERRHIGDAGSVLRFFPALEEVKLGTTGLKDVSFLKDLPRLRKLQFSSGVLEDLEPFRHCAALRDLSLGFSSGGPPHFTPPLYWLDARPLEALTELEYLTLSPNPAILAGMKFPMLHSAQFSGGNCMQPDCNHLPEMPALRLLKLDGVQSLRGISRFPELLHLCISGPLRDFGDISALTHLSCLDVETTEGWPREVSPLTALENLLWVRFGGDIPRNYWPLSQAPRLCELQVSDKVPAVQLEVQAINAALPEWDTLFGLPELRPLPPLRFVTVDAGGDTSVLPKSLPVPGPEYLQHPKLFHLELVWMHCRALAAARKVVGDEHGVSFLGPPAESNWTRSCNFNLQTLEAARLLPKILEALREAMAASPHPWVFGICVSLRLTKMEMTEQQKKWLVEMEEASRQRSDEFDLERYRLTQSHLIETQFRLRISEEEGEEPDPEDFIPPEEIRPEFRRSLVPANPESDDETEDNPDFALKPFDEQEQNTEDGKDDGEDKNVTTAPPPEPPPNFLDDPYEHPLADSYRIYSTLTFDTFYDHGRNWATAVHLMGREPDEHYPAPPEEKK